MMLWCTTQYMSPLVHKVILMPLLVEGVVFWKEIPVSFVFHILTSIPDIFTVLCSVLFLQCHTE